MFIIFKIKKNIYIIIIVYNEKNIFSGVLKLFFQVQLLFRCYWQVIYKIQG